MKMITKRIFSVLICLAITAAVAFSAVADEAPVAESIVVIAGSDIQEATIEEGIANVNSILNTIKNDGYESIDGFLFCGDYGKGYNAMDAEIEALKTEVKTQFTNVDDASMVFVKGNHDPANSKGLSKSGANDTEHYGVFVIHESDYMWYNKSESTIKKTAENLEKYLKEKSENGYNKPVFVTSHLSLAYSRRTYNDGDGMYAKYLFDVLNKYGESLNIIFMYGHNHNNEYDNYVGGTTVYLTKGDEIFISKLGKKKEIPDKYTLNFTYLNAGYVSSPYCLNGQKSMTVFEITGTNVAIKRYNDTKQIALKTKGAWSTRLNETADFFGATKDYLTTAYLGTDYIGLGDYDNGVTVINQSLKDLKVTVDETNPDEDVYVSHVRYGVECNGYTQGEKAVVKAVLPKDYLTYIPPIPVFVKFDNSNEFTVILPTDNRIVAETDALSSFAVFQIKGFSVDKGVFAYCPANVGEVKESKSANEQIMGNVYIVSKDKTETVGITPAMLKDKDGNSVELKQGTYADLDIYQGETKIYSGYTLTVTEGDIVADEATPVYIWIICTAGAIVVVAVGVTIVLKKKKSSK